MILAGSMLGCILPDIDNSHSSISRKWRFVSLLVTVGQAVIRGFSNFFPAKQKKYIRSMIGHRGLLHSLVPVTLMPPAGVILGQAAGSLQTGKYIDAGLEAGILSHLLFDMLSGGVPLFMPFSVRRITLAHIKTGGVGEWIFRISLTLIFCYFGILGR